MDSGTQERILGGKTGSAATVWGSIKAIPIQIGIGIA